MALYLNMYFHKGGKFQYTQPKVGLQAHSNTQVWKTPLKEAKT